MRRRVASVAAVAAMVAFPIAAGADSGAGEASHLGPFPTVADPDGGTCSPWALDNFDRFLTVDDNGDGTFGVRDGLKKSTFLPTGPAAAPAHEHGPPRPRGPNRPALKTLAHPPRHRPCPSTSRAPTQV